MKRLVFILLLAAAIHAQPVLTRTTGAFFALSVHDSAEAARWYRDVLGFTIVKEGEAPNGIAKFALLQRGHDVLEIVQHRDAAPRGRDAHLIHGIFKLGFTVPDLDAVYAKLKKRKIAIAYDLMPARDIPLRSFSIRDSDGNLVQFFGR